MNLMHAFPVSGFLKFFISLVVLFFSFLISSVALAQSEGLHANVSVQNATLLEQTQGSFTVQFSLTNKGALPQSDIRYGIDIVKASESGQTVIDSLVESQALSLNPGESQAYEMTYPVPPFLNGTYEVWIVSRTTSGLMLGLTRMGEVVFEGSGAFVEIIPSSCAVTIDGVDETYTLYQGVDVAFDEVFHLTCDVQNHTDAEVSVSPQFETFWRSTFGDGVEVQNIAQQVETLGAGEVRSLSFTIPKARNPQSYDVSLQLTDPETGTVRSNKVIAHYVLRGVSATIQNVVLNKSSYVQSDVLSAELFWTPSADSFEGSRAGEGSTQEVMLSFSVTDTSGNNCIEPITRTLPANEAHVVLNATTVAECDTPHTTLTIKDANGNVLDERVFVSPVSDEERIEEVARNVMSVYVYMITTIVVLLVLAYFINRSRKPVSGTAMRVLVLGLVFIGSFVGSSNAVEAVSFSTGYQGSEYINFVFNADRSEYAPGETVTVNASAYNALCANSLNQVGYTMDAQLLGTTRTADSSLIGGASKYHTFAFVAPTTPGTYTINVKGCSSGSCGTGVITIQVVAPSNATCAINAPATVPVNEYFTATLTAVNTGGTTWGSGYTLKGLENVSGNYSNFRMSGSIAPGQSTSWTDAYFGNERAPGTYAVRYQMSGPSGVFGQVCTHTYTVTEASGFSCVGTMPSNSRTHTSLDESGLTENTSWTYTPSNTDAKCEFECKPGYEWNGTQCVVDSNNTCTDLPHNSRTYTLYAGDDQNLNADTQSKYSAQNTSVKCEYACASGYTWTGSYCKANSYSCTGTLPANTTLYPSNGTGLTAETAYTHAFSDTSAKCEFTCNLGYDWNEGSRSCVQNTSTLPNLVSGEVTLSFPWNVLTVGKEVQAFSTVKNNGSRTTSTGFSDNFTYRWGTSGAWSPINTIAQTAMIPGEERSEGANRIVLTQSGALQIQHCVDAVPAAGVIVESSETDNCRIATFVVQAPPQCSDGIDNDGDGAIDYSGEGGPGRNRVPADPDCDGPSDDNESGVVVCTGTTPVNAVLCVGDDTGLSSDTAKTLVQSCGALKCEYTCSAGYALIGGACVSTSCPVGQVWNGSSCVTDTNCPSGQVWNGTVCTTDTNCPSDQRWDGTRCVSICPYRAGLEYVIVQNQCIYGSIDIDKPEIVVGDTAIVTWRTEDVPASIQCQIDGQSWSVTRNRKQSQSVSPPVRTHAYLYTLMCGGQQIDSTSLRVVATPSGPTGDVDVSSNMRVANQGSQVEIDWNTNGHSNCVLTGGGITVALDQSVPKPYPVFVYGNTTYTVTCDAVDGFNNIDSVGIEIIPVGFET
jgi:hypothetical protein